MSITDAVRSVLRQYVQFSGRARRSEYWWWVLATVVVAVLLSAVDAAIGTRSSRGAGLLSGLFSLATLLPNLAVFWRRMHDTGRSGLWILLGLVPFVGPIVLIVFACQDSEPGASNRFGPNPKLGDWGGQGYAPQYGQPAYGQPQYGAPQGGQPQYGAPQGGQPQYGQPQYGQPQYGQPQYGQPQYGQPAYGQPQGDQPGGAEPAQPGHEPDGPAQPPRG